MQSEVLARLKAIIADAEADMAEHFSEAKETGERADLADAEVCLLVDDAKAIVAALSAAEPVEWQRKTDDFGWQRVNAEDLPHYREKGAELRSLYAAHTAPAVSVKAGQPEGTEGEMTPDRAIYFLKRFKGDEKMLGPHEQWALDFSIAALSAQVQDVAGWMLVPIEPTDEMLFVAWDRETPENPDDDFYRSVYRDMLAAAPAKQEGGHD